MLHTTDYSVVRLVGAQDAEQIAVLCGQLGYPSSPEKVRRRLDRIKSDDHHAIYVAELPGGLVVGWVQVYFRPLVMADPQAEIAGLVVAQGYRGFGIGKLLMRQVEQWALDRGCGAVCLRSNIIRKQAHAFYERLGYTNIKTSLTFRKDL